jgi:proline iminopeptidase
VGAHTLSVPSITLTYTVRGTGPYLFIQAAGWGISSRYLQMGLSTLESQFTLIYPEPRGSGTSSRPENEEDMSDADMADDIERLRLHLGLSQIDLLGHSNGGTIVLIYAERYPDALRRLIVVTTGCLDMRILQR